jgi:hypothetical protein
MEPCPDCGCKYIGDDLIYATGWAKFCQDCGYSGPRVPIDEDIEHWRPVVDAEASRQWNDQALSRKLKALDDLGLNDTRFSA